MHNTAGSCDLMPKNIDLPMAEAGSEIVENFPPVEINRVQNGSFWFRLPTGPGHCIIRIRGVFCEWNTI
jgi:hypothetical protein